MFAIVLWIYGLRKIIKLYNYVKSALLRLKGVNNSIIILHRPKRKMRQKHIKNNINISCYIVFNGKMRTFTTKMDCNSQNKYILH